MNSEDFIQADSEAGISDGDFLFRTHRELFVEFTHRVAEVQLIAMMEIAGTKTT